jgi:hypothetical protein
MRKTVMVISQYYLALYSKLGWDGGGAVDNGISLTQESSSGNTN